MKKILITIFIALLVLNTLTGLVISYYKPFNWMISNFIIMLSVSFVYLLNKSSTSDGMKIGFISILSFFSVTSFLLAVILPPYIEDNLILICLLLSVSIQLLTLIIPKYLTKFGD